MVRIASEDICLVGLSDLDTGRMAEAPCLVEKVLSMLTAMGSAKPKTLHKLENALRPCTKVVPFYNPFEALGTANAMVEHPCPMVDVHYTKRQTSITSTHKLNLAFQTEIRTNAADCVFDVAVQDGEVEQTIIQDAQAWIHQCEKREGTKKELVKDFFKHCMKRVNHSSLEVAKKLEAKGYLKIDGDTVSYFLPELHATLSSQLKSISDGQSRTKASPFNMNKYMNENDIDIKDEVCTWLALAEGSVDPYDNDININIDVTGNGPEEYLMDILVLQTLSSVMKPSNLTDLLHLIKPQRLTYVVPPRRMIMQTASKIKDTQGKMKSQQTMRKNTKTDRDLAIGSPSGESQRRKQVPLTPEGLLGIDSHIFSTETNSTQSVNSAQPKRRPNKQSVALQSKGFAASLNKRQACQTSCCSAVLVPALECEKQEVVSRVIEWVDSYRSAGGASEHCVKSQLPTTAKLRNQLIDLCTIKVRRIPAASIVGCLQRFGYVTISSESPHKITYNIPTAKRPSGLQSTPKAPWQLRADDFRQTVQMCCSVYVERAFPSDISESKTSSEDQLSGKRKNSDTDQEVCSKKQKCPIHEMV